MYDIETDLWNYHLYACQKVYLVLHSYEYFHPVQAVLQQASSSDEDYPIVYAEFFPIFHHSQMLLNLTSHDLQGSMGYQQIVTASFHQLHSHPRRKL